MADQLRAKFPKLAGLMDESETDVLSFMSFPKAHRTQIHTTNPLERLNAEIKRRTDVVGIFPNEAAITRLVGTLLLEQNDEWALQRRYMDEQARTASKDPCGLLNCSIQQRFPRLSRSMFPATASAISPYDRSVTPAMCGVAITFVNASIGSSGATGSASYTSNPAPPRRPLASAAHSAW